MGLPSPALVPLKYLRPILPGSEGLDIQYLAAASSLASMGSWLYLGASRLGVNLAPAPYPSPSGARRRAGDGVGGGEFRPHVSPPNFRPCTDPQQGAALKESDSLD